MAGLFLVYSLMHLQPFQNFASLRLVPEDIPAIQRIETVARREKRYDVLYILASVLIKGPCQFHAAERERGMEPAIKKYLDGKVCLVKFQISENCNPKFCFVLFFLIA